MKIVHSIVFGIVTLAAGSVLAADAPATGKTRAEVRQEAINARASGQTDVGELPSYPETTKTATKVGKRKTKRNRTTRSTEAPPEAKP